MITSTTTYWLTTLPTILTAICLMVMWERQRAEVKAASMQIPVSVVE